MNIAAISTPSGIGGIAVIRISGPSAIGICDKIYRPFKSGYSLSTRKSHTLTYGQIIDPTNGEIIDEVVASIFLAPHSFTGENTVELSCHGSVYIQQRILDLLLAQDGLRLAEPGEFTRRAFRSGKMDLSQAEAVADLIAATTAASHRLAMNQMKGSISKKLDSLREQLLKMTSLLELELDFSEEEVEFADRKQLLELAKQIDNEVTMLSSTFSSGQAIKNGIPVAIIGAPNVGKSTLLNRLLKDDRAIVSPIQGTTRDLIEDTIALGGYLFRFIDTAGIRNTDDQIETMGIERSLRAAERAQIIILLTEQGVPFPEIVHREDQHIIYIYNKCDKETITTDNTTLAISALTGKGIDALEQKLIDIAMPNNSQGDIILTNRRHFEALNNAHSSLLNVIQGLNLQIPGDLVAEDLRAVIESLNSILGQSITSQDTLNNIFKNFCIGK